MIVMVHTNAEADEQSYFIGAVEAPRMHTMDTRSRDHTFWDTLLSELWDEWKTEFPEPDSDSQFIDWLIAEKDWIEPAEECVCVDVKV